jgi:O-acetyl-ADP-ribose deacetylase (regulator of RNase III)
MSKGLAKLFKDKFPDMHRDYQQRCDRKEVYMGKPYLYTDSTTWILNFPTKTHWRDKSKLHEIEEGLKYFVKHAKEWGIKSIAFPALGCGLGGLSWDNVYPIMCRYLQQLEGVKIEIFSNDDEPPVEQTKPITKFFKPAPHIKHPLTSEEKSDSAPKKRKVAASSETKTV